MTKAVKDKGEIRAKLFTNGRSQAVRLPKEFRFEGTEVRLQRIGDAVMLEPVGAEDHNSWTDLEDLYTRFSSEEADPIFPEGREQPPMQERDWKALE